jgi:hypothetical protein
MKQSDLGKSLDPTVQTYLVGKNVDLEELLQICDVEDGFLLPAVDVTNHGIKA